MKGYDIANEEAAAEIIRAQRAGKCPECGEQKTCDRCRIRGDCFDGKGIAPNDVRLSDDQLMAEWASGCINYVCECDHKGQAMQMDDEESCETCGKNHGCKDMECGADNGFPHHHARDAECSERGGNERLPEGYQTSIGYLTFKLMPKTGKTEKWEVLSTQHGDLLGIIKWFGRWRRFAYFPENGTIYDPRCLKTLNAFISLRQEVYREARNEERRK